ncbi:MAG: hypothetical protein AB7F22_30230 [Reyranella sp.]|uniref:hypothetical protein n=1 Tax=Reyranella sp. TaxID=1929291 RepID=UPI003D0C32A5
MSKRTPGKWVANCVGISGRHDNPTDVYEVVSADGRARVCEFVSEGDALLIAAAPELLEALRQIADMDYTRAATNCMGHDAVMLARAAIEKATGQ